MFALKLAHLLAHFFNAFGGELFRPNVIGQMAGILAALFYELAR